MLSPAIKQKIEATFGQKIKHARQCNALAAHISLVAGTISASTCKRLFGFIIGSETIRPWTKDLLVLYIGGYASWEELENELAGSKTKKQNRIMSVDCELLKPGTELKVMFGKTAFILIHYKGSRSFIVRETNKTALHVNDEVLIDKILVEYPLLVRQTKRAGTILSELIIGGITGVTEITDVNQTNTTKQSIGSLNSKIKTP
ncbi:MAG: hypothetical protein WBM13_13050 [Bacteroidia bacterium]